MQQQPAVAAAMVIYRQPARYRKLQNSALPAGILDVIKISAGDAETTEHWAQQLGVTAEDLAQASPFYLHQIMAGAGNNPLRLLCLDQKATPADIKLHKRWLLKWLHPDRNPSAWEANLFRRVNAAAKELERELDSQMEARASGDNVDALLFANLPASTGRTHDRFAQRSHRLKPPLVRVRKANWAALRLRIYRRILLVSALIVLTLASYGVFLMLTDRNRSLISHLVIWWR